MNINATFFAQMVVLFLLVLFTMKFVWPPLAAALDARAANVASGLKAAEDSRRHFETAKVQIERDLAKAAQEAQERLSAATRQAQQLLEDARAKAEEEATRIIQAAQIEAQQTAQRLRAELSAEVVGLAMQGAEVVLRKKVAARDQAELVSEIKKAIS